MRAVVDTNVWISALINPNGQPARILDALQQNRFDLVASTPLLGELATVLQRPRLVRRFNVTSEKTIALLNVLAARAEVVEIAGATRLCRDPATTWLLRRHWSVVLTFWCRATTTSRVPQS